MMNSKQSQIIRQQIKYLLEKESGNAVDEENVYKASDFLHLIADIALDNALEELRRSDKSIEYPNGFPFDKDGYCCQHCGDSASMEKGWFDKHGLKCMLCQHAVNVGLIPGSVIGDQAAYYTDFELKNPLNLSGKDITALIRHGRLKPRIVPGKDGKGTNFRIFIIAEQPKHETQKR